MRWKYLTVLTSVFILASSAYAIESHMDVKQEVNGNTSQSVHIETNQNVQEQFNTKDFKSNINIQITGFQISGTPGNFQGRMHDLELLREHMRSDFRSQFASLEAQFKARMGALRDQYKRQREEFQLKLGTLKDANRKTIVENVDKNLNTINTNRTSQMTNALNRMSSLIDSLQTKVDTAKSSGQDTTSAQAAIDKAKTDIQSALQLVSTQAAKDYPAQINNDTTLKHDVSSVVSTLRSDLQKVYEAIMTAKESVRKAAIEVYKLKIAQITNGPTSAPTATPTTQP